MDSVPAWLNQSLRLAPRSVFVTSALSNSQVRGAQTSWTIADVELSLLSFNTCDLKGQLSLLKKKKQKQMSC
jgi:hypothetical protein